MDERRKELIEKLGLIVEDFEKDPEKQTDEVAIRVKELEDAVIELAEIVGE